MSITGSGTNIPRPGDWDKPTITRNKSEKQEDSDKLYPPIHIDSELLPPLSGEKIAVLESEEGTLSELKTLYQQSLQKAGYTMIIAQTRHNDSNVSLEPSNSDLSKQGYSRQVWDTGWSIGLCLYSPGDDQSTVTAVSDGHKQSDTHCHTRRSDQMHLFQKFNSIPAIDSMFSNKQHFCRTMSAIRYIPALLGSPVSPLCYLLPAQYEEFLSQADAQGAGKHWVLKPLGQGAGPLQLVEPTNERDFMKIKRLSDSNTLVQEYLTSPLPLFGLPFSLVVYTLITSWLPLRVHLHSQGVVHFRHDYQRNFRKVPGRTWTFEQWLHHVTETHGQSISDIAQRNVETVIVETLLTTELVIDKTQEMTGGNIKRCSGCFQLISFELIFNSTFYPSIINIASNPDLSDSIRLDNWASGAMRSNVIHDMVSLVTTTASIVTDVAMALEELNLDINIATDGGCDGEVSSQTCLLPGDVQYLLSLRRESVQRGGFRMLYPSIEADRYTKLLSDLSKYSRSNDESYGNLRVHSTMALHQLSISFLRYLHNIQKMEESYDDLNIPLFSDQQLQNKESSPILLENVYHNTSDNGDEYATHSCTEDREQLPYLQGIYTEPALDLSPLYNISVTEYYATVPYHVFIVRVWAVTISCFSEARLEDKYGLSRPSNFTLGLGSNKISIVVVDATHTEPWAINVYTVTVYRQQAGEGLGSVDHGQPHTVCSLLQDCDLRYRPTSPCGLQQSSHVTWPKYHKHASSLPPCTTGDQSGEWLVPCRSCNQSDSCSWSSAVWQPYRCVHTLLPRDTLKQCLVQKQILFIGDSTNRGIMHYLMEQVNETLTEWDKTHNIKIYSNINAQQTSVSFAYYPQFWLPANQRPVFDKALFDLIKQSGPLENNHNTVLVVGGVHWLATHHLKVITHALKREGLDKIHVIVKGLGAGFHQAVDGLHCLSLVEQRKLVIHNAGLVEYARSQGFAVVDTFNMTMARYKDFLQGKCACHFHRVREVLPSFTQYMRSTGQSGTSKLLDMPILYHVEGDINAAYSEMLINRICASS